MTEEKLKSIIELQKKIEETKKKIETFDLLMKSYGLHLTIAVIPKVGSKEDMYRTSNKDEISRILQIERDILIQELTTLQNEFAEQ